MSASFDYARAVATAERLIARFGQSGSVRRPTRTGSAHNPTIGTPTTYPVRFAVIDFERKDIDGKRILVTDKRALIAPSGVPADLSASDELVEADGTVHKIIEVRPLKPAATVVFYDAHLRS